MAVEKHSVKLKVGGRLAGIMGWLNNQSRVAADLEQFATAILLLFQGHPSAVKFIRLGADTYHFNTGPIFENFLNERAGAGGAKWPAWSKAYAASRKEAAPLVKGGKRKGKPSKTALRKLYLTGLLEREATSTDNIAVAYNGTSLRLTITIPAEKVPYAKIHDEGGTINRPAIKPKNAKMLSWTWGIVGGKLVRGPFFAKSVGPCKITIPARPYLVVGSPMPQKYKALLDRMFRSWLLGILARYGLSRGVQANMEYEVTHV